MTICAALLDPEWARNGLLFVAGVVAALIGAWRCRIADRSLRQERYRLGAEMLDLRESSYVARVAGAASLAALARTDPSNYEELVVKTFGAFIAYPPAFRDEDEDGVRYTDYGSQDTVVIVSFLNARTMRQRKRVPIQLPKTCPLEVNDRLGISANRVHSHYMKWTRAFFRMPPCYEPHPAINRP